MWNVDLHGIGRNDTYSSFLQKFHNRIQFPRVRPRWIHFNVNKAIRLRIFPIILARSINSTVSIVNSDLSESMSNCKGNLNYKLFYMLKAVRWNKRRWDLTKARSRIFEAFGASLYYSKHGEETGLGFHIQVSKRHVAR